MCAAAKRATREATVVSNDAIRFSIVFTTALPLYANMNIAQGSVIAVESDFAKLTPNSMQLSCAIGAEVSVHSCTCKWFVLDWMVTRSPCRNMLKNLRTLTPFCSNHDTYNLLDSNWDEWFHAI